MLPKGVVGCGQQAHAAHINRKLWDNNKADRITLAHSADAQALGRARDAAAQFLQFIYDACRCGEEGEGEGEGEEEGEEGAEC